jgi:hypothetical protein
LERNKTGALTAAGVATAFKSSILKRRRRKGENFAGVLVREAFYLSFNPVCPTNDRRTASYLEITPMADTQRGYGSRSKRQAGGQADRTRLRLDPDNCRDKSRPSVEGFERVDWAFTWRSPPQC